MKILGLIPARGGSKGVPRKNIRELAGKPLIAYTIEAAQRSGVFSEIFVSTDDAEIATVAQQYGIDIPFLRPADLATDITPMLKVIEHTIQYFEDNHKSFDAVCLLQPTCPLRTAQQIKEAVAVFEKGVYDSIISVLPVPHKYNPHWVFVESQNGLHLFSGEKQPVTRRQDLPKAYIREGSIYIFRTQTIQLYHSIYGEKIGYYEVKDRTINIDTMEDFEEAQEFFKNLKI